MKYAILIFTLGITFFLVVTNLNYSTKVKFILIEKKFMSLGWSDFKFFNWIPTVVRLQAVRDDDWQVIRKSMLKTTLQFKYDTLKIWLEENKYSEKSKIQTQNYMQALRRSGLIE